MANKKKCDCLFCNSKCPECGSTEVKVKCGVEFTFTNDTEDTISIEQEWGHLELYCESCGAEIDSRDPKYRMLTERGGLQSAIMQYLYIPTVLCCEHKDDGKIEITPYHVGPAK